MMKTIMMKPMLTICLVSILTACQSKTADNANSQVVAKVNDDEITIHLLNSELKRVNASQSVTQDIQKKILGSLIDRQLLVQEAVKLNLDRTPEVVQLLDSAKAQIYAQAYLTSKLSTLTAPSQEEIQQFMAEHPAVFRDRKLFSTTDVIFSNDGSKVNYDALQTQVSNNEALKLWLNQHEIKFETAEEQLPTEALPPRALSVASNIKLGDLLFMHDENRIVVREVTRVMAYPMPPEQAVAMASKALSTRKQQQWLLSEIQRLKKMAKIEVQNSGLVPDDTLSARAGTEFSLLPEAQKGSTAVEDGLKGL